LDGLQLSSFTVFVILGISLDTFVVMENLKYFLASDNVQKMVQSDEPIVFGHPAQSISWDQCRKWDGANTSENQALFDHFFTHVRDRHATADYLAGGSGYVFNKQYLKEFVSALDSTMAPRGYPPEDLAHGITMMIRGIFPKPSTDKLGQSRFIPERR
jgi:hypothetical protein